MTDFASGTMHADPVMWISDQANLGELVPHECGASRLARFRDLAP